MKKNGFIATSILYSFFLIFLTLFIGLVANFLHNRILLAKIEDTSREILFGINNTKLTDLSVGDHIKFRTNDLIVDSNATWTLAKTTTSGDNVTLYFISDLTAQKLNIFYKRPGDKITKMHTMTVNLYETLMSANAYNNAISYSGFRTEMVNASILEEIKNANMEDMIKEALLNPGGNYLVRIDKNITGTAPNGTTATYVAGDYYEIKRYNFPQGIQQSGLLSNYCGGSFNGSNPVYLSSNTFGYMHVVNASVTVNQKYVDYCYYASPVAYRHSRNDLVVDFDENKPSDIISSKLSNLYNFRLMTTITLNKNSGNTYIAGGKGTVLDPYLFTNGVKQ